ncbi:WLM domain containing protein [Pyrenophora tritici-repentis]|nr:WLM domain containing protein [Pyrenophora tritici-repentis]KAI1583118.1 WLM domain containing protein [Pyrenophora tritici-repentis]
MPLGFERLNERTQRPNAHINFIRTLPGSTSATALAILNRVAAICYPFMKSHQILVQALEEYPYNTEFVGRNFNAGEVIQLVLRDRQGRWLPQRMVEMVMVHELAHCKQMNHKRKQRRILKKFGAGGKALGADDDTKVKLEKGVPKKGKPRVAGSARGRDLRAAAALARFDTVKKEDVTIKKEEEASSSDTDTEDEFQEGDQNGAAVDIDGKSMFDDKGRALIKICDDEDDKDGDARRERDEIEGFAPQRSKKTQVKTPAPSAKGATKPLTSKTAIPSQASPKTTLPNPPPRPRTRFLVLQERGL